MRIANVVVFILLFVGSAASAVGTADTENSSTATTTSQTTVSNPQFHVREVDDAWRESLPRDANAATQAYMDRLPADVIARSNAYFEGGYWLQLWNFIVGLGVAIVLLSGKRAARVRNWAQRVGRYAFIRDAIFGGFYAISGWLLSLPLTVYEGYFREHAYGMSTQTINAWFGEALLGLLVNTLITAFAIGCLYAVMRRAREQWWLWGTGLTVLLLIFSFLITPTLIDPLFNTYKPLDDGTVKSVVLTMARADGVPIDNVYMVDASRQTTRIGANVSGIFGSAQVRLNDNLLRTSLPEIHAVMGHELGHYVMHHIYVMIVEFAVLALMAFMFAQWAMRKLLSRYGDRWGSREVTDVASLPALMAVFSVFAFLLTPAINTLIRVQEVEADRFGFNLAREPHGAAEAYLKLTEYRKPDPGPVEEFIFFDHPSARSRIHDAMRWREAMGTP